MISVQYSKLKHIIHCMDDGQPYCENQQGKQEGNFMNSNYKQFIAAVI